MAVNQAICVKLLNFVLIIKLFIEYGHMTLHKLELLTIAKKPVKIDRKNSG